MKRLSVLSIALAAALAACSGGSMSPPVVSDGSAAGPTQILPMDVVAAGASSLITFSPSSPLTLPANTTATIAVDESNYHGEFIVKSCSGYNCTPNNNGNGFSCYSGGGDLFVNSVSASIANRKLVLMSYVVGLYYTAVLCRFRIADSHGNYAVFKVSTPGY